MQEQSEVMGEPSSRPKTRPHEVAAREEKDGKGVVRLGWVKAHMDILGNEATDVLAKQAAEGVP